jgi:hypothetical protein
MKIGKLSRTCNNIHTIKNDMNFDGQLLPLN